MKNKLFSNLTIIELANVLAGPATGTFFSELGASVIKIENKQTGGDITRKWKLPSELPESGISAYYSSANYNKSVLLLDLTTATDRKKVYDLVAGADMVISNYKSGDDKKLGMDHKTLTRINNQLIYGQINGFGSESKRVAFDLVLQAESGFMSMNGTAESGPVKMPVAMIDLLAAHQLKEGLLIALLRKQTSGKGALVTVSLYESAIAALANQASNWLMANHIPQRIGSLHPNIAPYGEIFLTRDKKEIVLAIGTDRQFEKLCKLLDQPDLAIDSRFSSNANRVQHRKILAELLAPSFLKDTRDSWMELLLGQSVPVGAVKNLQEVFAGKTAQKMILEEPDSNGPGSKRVSSVAFRIT